MKRILAKFPGEPVHPKRVQHVVNGELRTVDKRDILGADLYYDRELGFTKWCMAGAIDRCLKAHRFGEGGKGRVTTPYQPHADLTQG